MKLNSKKQVFAIFQNRRVQAHHQDGSILQWKNTNILYISNKGIKNLLSLQIIHRTQDLYDKFKKCLDKYNQYSIQHDYIHYNNRTDKQELQNVVKMSVKIQQFRWQNPQIEQCKDGYLIISDCRFASLKLKLDLYIVQVSYHQYMGGKNTYLAKTPNMTKLLLQKYNYDYQEFPTFAQQKQNPQYFYTKHAKKFTIFNIPNQWKYPLQLIWNALVQYRVIPHQFCYFEYSQKQMTNKTVMPKLTHLLDMLTNQNNKNVENGEQQLMSVPILGKIAHNDKCLMAKMGDCTSWLTESCNFAYDNIGFWFYFRNVVAYRKINKLQIDHEFYPKAIPYMIRFKNEPQRAILDELQTFIFYCEQNSRLQMTKQIKNQYTKDNSKFDNQNNLVKQQNVQQVGNFKAYSNGIVIVKFIDRCMLTLNSKKMQAKIISKSGETCIVNVNNPEILGYRNNRVYITPALNFQQRTFYPQEWLAKQKLSQQINSAIQISEVFQKTSQTYLNM